jgi:septal ring factor EnvC (AmiA/AmiB activator)
MTKLSSLQVTMVRNHLQTAGLAGVLIAAAGSTGASTAPHLHYEVLKDDVPVDPLALLE